MQETLIGYEAPPGGPSYIGQLAEVAVGTYTSIEAIIAPAEASPGDLVTVEVRVKNLYTGTIYIATTGRYDSVDILPTEDYAIVDPGATRSFYFSFTMPNKDVELRVWSFFWTGEEWYQDDYSYIDIALTRPEEKEVNMGFTLKITNVPEGAAMWTALFYNEPRIYSPVLELDEPWDYADDPEGRTDLMIRIFDSDLREIFTDTNLGPIEVDVIVGHAEGEIKGTSCTRVHNGIVFRRENINAVIAAGRSNINSAGMEVLDPHFNRYQVSRRSLNWGNDSFNLCICADSYLS
ncbi:unnamed protein product [marine sediment metagenome]|uniref:Uncharacterized protein n=1 Tax=marine sediment metagenome TaxID=412755 RepID=X1S306_9ZZZZ